MPTPRYQVIFAALQERIAAGQYPVGRLLPTEQELCAEFEVSRYTVREALRRLSELGLVARRQGSGSEVISQEPRNDYVQTMRSLRELTDYAAETVLEILSSETIVADERLSRSLGRASGRKWLQVHAIRHLKTGEPICFSEIHIHGDFHAIAKVLGELRGPFYAYIEEAYDVTVAEVVQTISVVPMPPSAAKLLESPGTQVAAKVVRRYLGPDDEPILISTNWHLAESFSYTMTLRREDLSR